MEVSTTYNEYIENKYERQAHWYVTLSNGQTVYQDDENPIYNEHSAWLRLKKYVESNNLAITSMFVKFRSHVVCVFNNTDNVDGVFFRHSALGSWGNPKTTLFYVIGVVKNSELRVWKYQVPEIEIFGTETRPIEDSLESIIWNANLNQRCQEET